MGTVIPLNRPTVGSAQKGDRQKAALAVHAVLTYLLQNAEEAGLEGTADAIALAITRTELELEG